ncbi:RNase H domain-containing protein [Trichonephila clavipes]|nr:RNase H domain-containing protein [Trichonephila clavipes]
MKKSAAEAHRMLSNTYGEAAISERTCREWSQRFKNGDFDVEDQHDIWWDQLGVVYYELLKPTEIITEATTSNPVDPEDHMVLTSTEIHSRAEKLLYRTWVIPPVHPWYFQRHTGSVISFKGSRSYQTAFSRFSTVHLRIKYDRTLMHQQMCSPIPRPSFSSLINRAHPRRDWMPLTCIAPYRIRRRTVANI